MIVLVEACEYEVVIHFLRTSDFVSLIFYWMIFQIFKFEYHFVG